MDRVKVFGGLRKKENGKTEIVWHIMTWTEFTKRKKELGFEFGFDVQDTTYKYAWRYAKGG